jgi:hypothetical protein
MKLNYPFKALIYGAFISSGICYATDVPPEPPADNSSGLRKVKDVVIYEDAKFYSSFPSVIKRPGGELLVAFRRAPDRRIFGEKGNSHVDPNSYLVMVRSRDGETWTKEPGLIYAHPFGGSQDPCLLQLRDGTLICTSYGWALVRKQVEIYFWEAIWYVLLMEAEHGRDRSILLQYHRKFTIVQWERSCLHITEEHYMKVKAEGSSGWSHHRIPIKKLQLI